MTTNSSYINVPLQNNKDSSYSHEIIIIIFWMSDQFISIETDVPLVQNTSKQYNTNTETAYSAPQTLQHEISKSVS